MRMGRIGQGALAAAFMVALSFGSFAAEPTPDQVLATYADIALAGFEDSLAGAQALDAAIDALIASPSDATLNAAREAWLTARIPYLQTEAFRFGNPIVDDWEPRVNAWPLDEGLIDYVTTAYGSESDLNRLYVADVIANPSITADDVTIDASVISPELLRDQLQEAGGIEANVATGYHAIEFLLWGQDTNGTGPGAGTRPATDYDVANCTGGNCDRRAQYLKAASTLLLADLEEMVGNWQESGAARTALQDLGIPAILTGMGSMSYGELAGQRMKVGLLLHDPEEEHDCFSDNTHNSYYYDAVGIRNVYLGSYTRPDGAVVSGPSISELLASKDPALDTEIKQLLDESVARMEAIRAKASAGEHVDQLIGEGNTEGNAMVQAAIDALIAQTRGIERAVTALGVVGVTIEQSDSLTDPALVTGDETQPGAVFQ